MSAKYIVLFIISMIFGIALIGTGVYFLSKKFLSLLNESSPDQEKSTLKKNELRAKMSAYISFALGALTIIWGAIILLFPQAALVLSFIYMIFFMTGSVILIFAFK